MRSRIQGNTTPARSNVSILLLTAMLSVSVFAQPIDDDSIPEPTNLGTAAAQDGAVITMTGAKATFESANATAELSGLVITMAKGDRHEGVRIRFRDQIGGDEIFLSIDEAARLRDEMDHLQMWFERERPCEAQRVCVMGVARCRPSQTEQQAFCPGYYATPEGERGVAVSSPRRSFRFPATAPRDLSTSVDSVLEFLR